jgi:type IV pilus assembly protein PilM
VERGIAVLNGKFTQSGQPIGLDLAADALRLLQLAPAGDGWTAVAAAEAPLPAGLKPTDDRYPDAFREALRSALASTGFQGRRVVSALPSAAMMCKNLRLPPMPADELAAAVQWEATDRFRFEPGQAVVQYLSAGQVSQGDDEKLELIVLASKLDFVEAHVAVLTAAGLKPEAIDARPSALSRLDGIAASQPDDGPDQARLLIDLGAHACQVLIVRRGRVHFFKTIEMGSNRIDSVAGGVLGVSLEQATRRREAMSATDEVDPGYLEAARGPLQELGREIGLCLRYFGVTFRGARPTAGRLIGAAAWSAVPLGEAAGITLRQENPLQSIDLSAVRETIRPGHEGDWATATGLSLRGCKSGIKRKAVAA